MIRGVIFEMTIHTPHATSSRLTSYVLRAIFGAGWVVSEALPLDTGRRSLIEPDLTVVAGSIRDFSQVHPTTAALVVEISDATLRKDRTLKAHVYAQAGIADYWIVNLGRSPARSSPLARPRPFAPRSISIPRRDDRFRVG